MLIKDELPLEILIKILFCKIIVQYPVLRGPRGRTALYLFKLLSRLSHEFDFEKFAKTCNFV